MTAQRILFTGSRSYSDRWMVRMIITGLVADGFNFSAGDRHMPIWICHGDAPGLDTLVKEEARQHRAALLRVKPYPADWQRCAPNHPHVPCPDDGGRHRRRKARYTLNSSLQDETFCPIAGLRRNQDMLDDFKPSLVLAFFDKPYSESRGTKDMCERAIHAGVPHHRIFTGDSWR